MNDPLKHARHLLTDHPASVGETYWEHQINAWTFALKLLLAAAACGVHGLLPFLFERTASRRVEELHELMVIKRNRKMAPCASVQQRSY